MLCCSGGSKNQPRFAHSFVTLNHSLHRALNERSQDFFGAFSEEELESVREVAGVFRTSRRLFKDMVKLTGSTEVGDSDDDDDDDDDDD